MPPNLDLNRHRTSPLANVCPPDLLDTLHGFAGLLDTNAKWWTISRSWDDFFARTNRPNWRREAMLGKTLFELFPDDDQRQMFRKLLASMGEGKLEQHAQVVEFGSGAKALHLNLVIRPLWEQGTLIGYFVQGMDVTREHLNRIALLDRDRRMRELQTVIEEQKQRIESVLTQGRERDERLHQLQTQVEHQSSEQTERLARKTLEHTQEVNQLHAELEQLANERTRVAAVSSEEYERQIRSANEAHVRHFREFSNWASRLNSAFREQPAEFPVRLCRLFRELTNCYFTTFYKFEPDTQEFLLCAHGDAPEIFRVAIENKFVRIRQGEGPCGTAALHREPLKFAQLLMDENYTPWVHLAQENGYNCLWAIPLRLDDELFGVLQLYFKEPDVEWNAEQQLLYTSLAQTAVPLLSASEKSQAETESAASPAVGNGLVSDEATLRYLAAELAEAYRNLLTGVLGHSTLAAAEIGDAHAAVEDIHAIERAARTAAKLTRKLAALSGASKRSGVVEIGSYLQNYLKRNQLSDDAHAPALPVAPCEVRSDMAALEVILDGITEYAGNSVREASCLWTVQCQDHVVTVTLLCDHALPKPTTLPQELLLAREAARANHGDIQVQRIDEQMAITLTLPLSEKTDTVKN